MHHDHFRISPVFEVDGGHHCRRLAKKAWRGLFQDVGRVRWVRLRGAVAPSGDHCGREESDGQAQDAAGKAHMHVPSSCRPSCRLPDNCRQLQNPLCFHGGMIDPGSGGQMQEPWPEKAAAAQLRSRRMPID